jgi:hypothetical protein
MSNIIERRIFVDTIIKNGIISVNEIYEEMVKNDFSNGYSTDKNYIYSRLKTLGIDLIKIRIFEVGTVFGDLTVLEHIGSDKHGQIYRFKCTCGNIIERNTNKLPKSCGCRRYYYSHSSKKNNKTITPQCTVYCKEDTILGKQYKSEYKIYGAMKQRCYNPKHNRYYLYGGKGIKVCDRWLENFKNFFDDMGQRPSDRHSIDRIDSNGMYEPTNCRWATYSEQNTNKSWEHYECPYCKELIGQKSNFNKHLLIHEKEEEIMKFYNEGKTQIWIADELSIPVNRVRLLLKTKK